MSRSPYVRRLALEEEADWDALVESTEDAGSFLRSDVLRLLAREQHPEAELVRLVVVDGNTEQALGGWALLVRKKCGLRYSTQFPYYYNGPFVAPPLDRDPGMGAKRLAALFQLALAVRGEVDVLDAECTPGLQDIRGLRYAGLRVEQRSCHVWRAGEPPILKRFNRTKRNEARRAMRTYTFGWEAMNEEGFSTFRRLHDVGLQKFSWNPPEAWRQMLDRVTRTGEATGLCRFFGARDEQGTCRAMVSILFNSRQQTACLWRVGVDSDQVGLIAAMYAEAAEAVREEKGTDWEINFGGSPRVSLSQFKDYLGAEAVFHSAIIWQRPGWPWLIWNGTFGLKELRFALLRRLHGILRS